MKVGDLVVKVGDLVDVDFGHDVYTGIVTYEGALSVHIYYAEMSRTIPYTHDCLRYMELEVISESR